MSFFCFREYVFVGDIGNMEIMLKSQKLGVEVITLTSVPFFIKPARKARARRACALRALGLLLADGTPTVGGGKTF